MGIHLSELQAFDEFVSDGSDTLLGGLSKSGSGLGMGIAENDPDAGTVGLVAAGTDGARKLREFERERR
jgi:hypothetical protein